MAPTRHVPAKLRTTRLNLKDWISDPVPFPFRVQEKDYARLVVKEINRRIDTMHQVEKSLTTQRQAMMKTYGIK